MKESNAIVLYLLVYMLCVQVALTNSRTSTLWQLNPQEGKIQTGLPNFRQAKEVEAKTDNIFDIISTTVLLYDGTTWKRYPEDRCCGDNVAIGEHFLKNNHSSKTTVTSISNGGSPVISHKQNEVSDILDCGKPVNFTYYDDLIGIAQRFSHPMIPEPEVAYLFLKKKGAKGLKNFDINALEKRLKKAKREKPRSVQLYNQIGNFWRIKGDARLSIECFRRALAVSPTNAEVLLNLARVLFNLQYLDDAIHLTRRSLEVQPPDRSAWRQYFTLGEIFKAYGHFQESVLHLRHALELYPHHEPIKQALRDAENIPSSTLHVYTIIIIVCLAMGVLLVILSSSESNPAAAETEPKVQRHFNRAMAMRSLRGFTARTVKYRK